MSDGIPAGSPDGPDRPATFNRFSARFPEVTAAHANLGAVADEAGPLDARDRELVKIGICVGADLESATRSHVRRALALGVTPAEIEHAVLQALTTLGFSPTVRGWVWATEQIGKSGGGTP